MTRQRVFQGMDDLVSSLCVGLYDFELGLETRAVDKAVKLGIVVARLGGVT
jgi:hypothetical protein